MRGGSVTLVLTLVVAAAAILLAWQEGGGARAHRVAARERRVDLGPPPHFGRRIVLNGWDLPRL